jgi:Fungal specific transcription factor domain
MEPAQVSPIWLAQLFAMLSIASRLDSASALDMAPSTDAHLNGDLFSRATANALVLGKYKTPQKHAVEALLLFSQSRYISNLDSVQELWTSFGVIVRLAMLMGYHRDAQHLAGVSAYEGEMRRRTWAVIEQLDILHSFQLGLPSFIHSDMCDVEVPHNLTDNDFHELTTHLPASKQDSETTDILYFIVRSRMLNLVREVIRLSLALKQVHYDEVMKMEAQLRRVHDSIPLALQRRPISQSFTDSTHSIVARINCELLYQKSLCILHRKYLFGDPGHFWSKKTCTGAALIILEIQAELRELSLRGGQLSRDRWLLSSVTLHDFLLAATILCLDLAENPQNDLSRPCESSDEAALEHKLGALKRAHIFFVEQAADSKQARRCARAIGYMLPRIESKLAQHNNPVDLFGKADHPGNSIQNHDIATMNLGMLDDFQPQLGTPKVVDWVSRCRDLLQQFVRIADTSYTVTFRSIPKPLQRY